MTSTNFRRTQLQDTGYVPLVLLRITHPDIPRIVVDGRPTIQVVRVARDNQGLTRNELANYTPDEDNGDPVIYQPLPFSIERPTSREGEVPVLELTIDRLDDTIAHFVDISGGAQDADVTFVEIDRLRPYTDERTIRLKVKRSSLRMGYIKFTLSFPNLFKIPSVQQSFYPESNPGLFQ